MAPDLRNLKNCIDDVRAAVLDADSGPADPTNYSNLRGRLVAAKAKLPPLYRQKVYEPYFEELGELGENDFTRILLTDPTRERLAGLMLDIAHAILENGEAFEEKATDAFQEVVSDLFDGFLSAEDRRDVNPPDHGTVAPLVKWGNPDFGPYTWPVDATEQGFKVGAGVVNLPPGHARRGLLAWAALGHEVGGHDILHADTGLSSELASAVFTALEPEVGAPLAAYWSDRIDETASDVLGILNMGPVPGIGLVGFFRALANDGKLRNRGPSSDPHPADIVRGFLAAETTRLLSFEDAQAWGDAIEEEVLADVGQIRLAGQAVSKDQAKKPGNLAKHRAYVRHATLEDRAEGVGRKAARPGEKRK